MLSISDVEPLECLFFITQGGPDERNLVSSDPFGLGAMLQLEADAFRLGHVAGPSMCIAEMAAGSSAHSRTCFENRNGSAFTVLTAKCKRRLSETQTAGRRSHRREG